MADAVARARRQLARRRWLRRWLPSAIVTTAVPLAALSSIAWVWPRATTPVVSRHPLAPRVLAPVSGLASQADALRALSGALSASEAQIAALPRPSGATESVSLPPLPSLSPAQSFSAPPASHATTGASGAP
ncbi:MAG TPA: hypothetical protein VNF50_08925 [Acidimicrobiales bacterium]|nr:hypothetical protein [Acidimicrobiales bacterium]